jgi:hypothetical protein
MICLADLSQRIRLRGNGGHHEECEASGHFEIVHVHALVDR